MTAVSVAGRGSRYIVGCVRAELLVLTHHRDPLRHRGHQLDCSHRGVHPDQPSTAPTAEQHVQCTGRRVPSVWSDRILDLVLLPDLGSDQGVHEARAELCADSVVPDEGVHLCCHTCCVPDCMRAGGTATPLEWKMVHCQHNALQV